MSRNSLRVHAFRTPRRAHKAQPSTKTIENKLFQNESWKTFIDSVPLNQAIYLTIGNLGYLRLVLNLYHTLQETNCKELKYFIVLTCDRDLKKALKPWPCIKVFYLDYRKWSGERNPLSSQAVRFKNQDWNAITRFKLFAVWTILQCERSVFYIDPDITFVNDPSNIIQSLTDDGIYLQKGEPYCSGVIYASPNPITLQLFDPENWHYCGQDDETYLKVSIRNMIEKRKIHPSHFQTFDWDLFPNGLLWKNKSEEESTEIIRAWIQKGSGILIHFNHIAGIESKLKKMKATGAFISTMTIVQVPEKFKPDLAKICIQRKGTTYPPHQKQSHHLEEACEALVRKTIKERLIASKYTYLPIHWTAIATSGNNQLVKELQTWCEQFFTKHQRGQFWTVVQHCKGLFGSCGVNVPSNTKLFLTSDPNAALSLTFRSNPTPKKIIKQNPTPQRPPRPVQYVSPIQRQLSAVDQQRLLKAQLAWRKARKNQRTNKHINNTKPKNTNQPNPNQPKLNQPKNSKLNHNQPKNTKRPNTNKTHQQPNTNQPKNTKRPNTNKIHQQRAPILSDGNIETSWITIPLVSANHRPFEPTPRTILASFIGSIKVHSLREKMLSIFNNQPDCVIRSGAYNDPIDAQMFRDTMKQSVFALCPRGFGSTSFRLTEAMQYGCIPVYISDTFSIPFKEHLNFEEVCILVKEEELETLPQKLRSFSAESIKTFQTKIKEYWSIYFSLDGCCNTILFDYIDQPLLRNAAAL